ncbi:MAG: choline ABC transporter substrate-binding protein [Spirochaetales bacterium]|nr:choline ABC transporter substrate-binding protein [Spirochaetales bacterium]
MKRSKSLFFLMLVFFTFSCEKKDDGNLVRIVEVGWSDIIATTSVAEVILDSIGYDVERNMVSVPIAFQALANDDADIFLGYWKPSMNAQVKPHLDTGKVVVLGKNLTGAKYTLAVPSYAYDEGLKDFADIAKYADKLNSNIYGIEAGNDGNQLILDIIGQDAFGLGSFQLVESSEAGMLGEVKRKISDQQWIVFLAWAPHPMNSQYQIEYLSGGDDFFGPDYGAASVHTCVRENFEQDDPNLARFFKQLVFDVSMESKLMEGLSAGENQLEVAREYLLANPAFLEKVLDGVTSYSGDNGLETAKKALK